MESLRWPEGEGGRGKGEGGGGRGQRVQRAIDMFFNTLSSGVSSKKYLEDYGQSDMRTSESDERAVGKFTQ